MPLFKHNRAFSFLIDGFAENYYLYLQTYQEKLKVKSRFKTTQTVEELESAFTPGSEFGFDATIDFDKSDHEATSSGSEFIFLCLFILQKLRTHSSRLLIRSLS